MNLDNLYKSKASLGRFGDTELRVVDNNVSHVNKLEASMIDEYGPLGEEFTKNIGSGTINPETGLKEYNPALWAAWAAAATIGSAVVGLLSESSAGATKEKQAEMNMDYASDKKDLLTKSKFDLKDVEKSGKEVISAGYVSNVGDLSFGAKGKYSSLKGGYESKVTKANLAYGTAEKSYDQATDFLTEGFNRKRDSLYDSFTKQTTEFEASIQSQRDEIDAQITSADYQSDLASIEKKSWYPGKYAGKLYEMFTGQYQA